MFVLVEDNPEITRRIAKLMALCVAGKPAVDYSVVRKQLGCEASAYAWFNSIRSTYPGN